jgi:hypothetical protein
VGIRCASGCAEIDEISGLDLEKADRLTVGITVKLVRLRRALKASSA